MKRWLCYLAFLVLAVFPTASARASDIPSLVGPVNDYAEVLSPTEEESLTASLATIETYPGKPQVVILTTPSLNGKEVEEYALEVARAWGIGQNDRNNGLVIVLAPNDGVVRFEVGYGLEGAIPDAMKVPIFERRMKPHLTGEKKNYGAALTAAVETVDRLIKGETTGDALIDGAPAQAEHYEKIQSILLLGALACAILGMAHWSLAGLAGSATGFFLSGAYGLATWLFVPVIIVGFPAGIVAHFFLRAWIEARAGVGGGISGGSSGGGGFRGGGGGFGGGGITGRF